jgi:zinc protease
MRFARHALMAAACVLFSTGSGASSLAPQVAPAQERVLENGMRIVVREDRRAPVVASMVWYRAGSVDEVNGLTGLAHVTEHMMFRGTRRLPDGEFSRRVAQLGGRDNAFTGRDYTAYHQQLAAKDLPVVIELEAERMANLTISNELFSKEMQVVMSNM